MKKILIILTLLLALFNEKAFCKWFQQKTIYSKALQKEKTYYVGLPSGYNASDKNTKYPVIIFLHGASVTASDIVSSFEPLLDNLITRILFDKLFRVIFVIPDGSCEPYKGSFYTNSALYGNYEDYIINDLTEEIRNNYNTYNYREKWCIMGHSMGGFGAMKIALKHTREFIGVSALSGPLNITWYNDLLPMMLSEHGTAPPYNLDYTGDVTKLFYSMAGAFSPAPEATPPVLLPVDSSGNIIQSIREMWEKHNPINLVRSWKGNPSMAIHLYCGEKDEYKLAVHNRMFSDTLKKYNLPHTYYQDLAGDHSTSLFTSFPQGVNFLYHVMDTAQTRTVTSIKIPESADACNIYPNPASDRFYISGQVQSIRQVIVYTISGQKVLQTENSSLHSGTDISMLARGTYLVLLEKDRKSHSYIKLIKR